MTEQARTVTCHTEGCQNDGISIDVPDDGTMVICGGGCNNVLAEEADWYEPPEPERPSAEDVAGLLGDMTPEERERLVALLAGGDDSGDSQAS